MPTILTLEDLYSFAHEIGHIINLEGMNENTEENAWNEAFTICSDNEIPTDRFELVREYCMRNNN